MSEMNSKNFKQQLTNALFGLFGTSIQDASEVEIYLALVSLLRGRVGEYWADRKTGLKQHKGKQMYYLSMEYLTGTFTEQYLHYLGLYDLCREGLEELGYSLRDICRVEREPALGNGGLGRLAAAFLDSLASLKLPGHGYGLRYERGLFKQAIHDGQQTEQPDYWLDIQNPWEYKQEDVSYEVKLGGRVDISKEGEELTFTHRDYYRIKAVAYDIPILGYRNHVVNTLRLWSAESIQDVDFEEFAKGNYSTAFQGLNTASSITQFLYPNDHHWEGKKLRLKQEYFLVSASIQDLLHKYKAYHEPIQQFPEYFTIHINDTHPALAIPEFMRILIDEMDVEWEAAWQLVLRTFAFTNHTILSEAMEKWDIHLYKEVLPRIYHITEEIHHRFLHEIRVEKGIEEKEELDRLSILEDHWIKMLNLSIVGSYSVNGVAQLHTDILKERELQHFYRIYPEKFNNKTNGIIHRKWLMHANPRLTRMIERRIGEDFKRQPLALEKLLHFKKDPSTLEELFHIKHENKVALANRVFEEQGITINPYSIFDIHIKRIHEYKRQFMNILHIIHLYNRLKENAHLDITPRTFFFAGKAAPGYYIAKEIIRLINAVAQVINNDLTIKDRIKVVFIPDYNVSKAMELIPAANVSEQISTTTKEASGTGNMKFMMNGAITLATLDGANVEIAREVGEENIVIFGLKDYEVYEYYKNNSYHSEGLYRESPVIQRTLNRLVDHSFTMGGKDFRDLFDLLIRHNDTYFILRDFEDYISAQERIGRLYRNKEKWQEMSLINIAKSGIFSSDYTIQKYAEEIWHIKPV